MSENIPYDDNLSKSKIRFELEIDSSQHQIHKKRITKIFQIIFHML
jgi:hypothetical protein